MQPPSFRHILGALILHKLQNRQFSSPPTRAAVGAAPSLASALIGVPPKDRAMRKLHALKHGHEFAFFALLDTIWIGTGMGVPVFCILFGFVVGWYIAGVAMKETLEIRELLKKIFACGAATSAYTFLVMACIWGPCTIMLFEPGADLAHFGIPMILFDPTVSFIGWIVLMVLISPFLQFLTTLFASHLTLMIRLPHAKEELPLQARG